MAVELERSTTPAVASEEVDGVLYPYAEEEPVVQSDWHNSVIFDAKAMVKAHLLGRPEAFVGSDIYVYWEKGDNRKKVAPDLFVCPRVEPRGTERKSFYVWRELSGPQFVLEVLSESTQRLDWGPKFHAYRVGMRVPEYFLFSPHHHPPCVWGFRLRDGEYEEIARDARGRVWSEQMEVWIGTEAGTLIRLWDAQDRRLLTHTETVLQAQMAADRAEAEAHRADEAEARIRELEAELRKRG